MILVIGIAFTSKAVDFAYVLPIFATHHEGLLQQPFLLGILCLSFLLVWSQLKLVSRVVKPTPKVVESASERNEIHSF